MKKCTYCVREIEDQATICPSCNRDLTGAVPGDQALEAKTSGKAVASLILSLFSFLFLPGIIAVVLGHISRSEIRKGAGRLKGEGVALVGLVLGYLGIAAILLIAAIAIPGLLRDRIAANEASAVGSLRALNTATRTYAATYGKGFPSDVATLAPSPSGGLGDSNAANLIDEVLASGKKAGYVFNYTVTGRDPNGLPSAYIINADPAEPGTTGRRHFFTDETGVIRMEQAQPATKESPPFVT